MRWGVLALVGTAWVATLPGFGCGKTTIASTRISDDGGAPKDSSLRDDTKPDGRTRDTDALVGRTPDGGAWPHPITDAAPRPTASDASDVDATFLDCAALGPIAGRILTARRPMRVLFSPDGRYIIMIVRAEVQPPGGGTMDDLVLITLPSGAMTTLAHRVRDVSWLGQTNMLFVKSSDSELQVVDLAGRALAVAPNVCDYVGTPDGRYVYVVRDCDFRSRIGHLDVVDLQTNQVTGYADVLAQPGNLSLLANGRWIAYVAASLPGDGSAPIGNVHLRDRTINHFPIGAPYPNSTTPWFFTDLSLLFQVPNPPFGTSDVYRYTFGDTSSYRMATNRHVGFGGYKISPDRGYLLNALLLQPGPNELYVTRLDDAVETLVASDLLLYQENQVGPIAFAFTRDGSRAVYVVHPYAGTATVPVGGGAPTKVSNGNGFAVSPYADRVATLETAMSKPGDSLYVSDPSSSTPSLRYDSSGSIKSVTFVPADRGLLFVESGTPQRLRHLSFRGGAPTDLGTWTMSDLPLAQYPLGEMQPVYPVDPTGCYVVVDNDAPGAAGVSIALVPNDTGPRD